MSPEEQNTPKPEPTDRDTSLQNKRSQVQVPLEWPCTYTVILWMYQVQSLWLPLWRRKVEPLFPDYPGEEAGEMTEVSLMEAGRNTA